MFLAAHTIKGGAAMMRLTQVELLAHALEDLLSKIRDEQRVVDADMADLLFQAIDRLRALIDEASSESVGAEPAANVLALADQLRAGSPLPAAARARRALVVETSPTVRELERMLVEDAGYEVETCADVQTAMQCASSGEFSLLVAGVSGLELCAIMGSTPVVLMTTEPHPALKEQALRAGARALVRKGSLADSELTRVLRELN
jgi:chemotaxis protein histidine kinase CheA